MYRYDEVRQHVNFIEISGQLTPKVEIIFVHGNNVMGSDIHTRMEEN